VTTSSVRRAYSPYAPALKNVEAELIVAPIAPCTIFPEGKPGTVTINGAEYGLAYIAHNPGDVDGYQITADGKVYDLTADLTSCDCPDATYRIRPGGCKHATGLRLLRDAEKIA